jgi:hypothetical protein
MIRNPLKTVPAASTEAIIVLSGVKLNMKAVTSTIADANTAIGIRYVTALEGQIANTELTRAMFA